MVTSALQRGHLSVSGTCTTAQILGLLMSQNLQLVDLPHGDHGYELYVALSFVCGEGGKYRTLLKNMMRQDAWRPIEHFGPITKGDLRFD